MVMLVDDIRAQLQIATERCPRLSYAIAIFVLLCPVCLLGNGLADVAVSAAAGLFIIRCLIQRDAAWAKEPWIAVALMLWIYLVARGFLSVDPERSGLKALGWIRFIVFGAAIHFVLSRSPCMRTVLLSSIVAMAAFGAADALFQYVVGHDIFGRPMYGMRLSGPLKNPTIGMLLAIVGLPATFHLVRNVIVRYRAQRIAWPSAIILVMMAAAIVLSGERTALLFTIGLTGIITFIMSKSLVKSALICGFFGILVVATVFGASPKLQERQLSTFTELSKGGQSIYMRAMYAGIEVIKDNPIFGVGPKNFQAHCAQSAPVELVGDACRLIHPHQVWLHITSETGVVGAAGFLTLFVLALYPAVLHWRSWADEPLLAGTAIAIIVLLSPITPSGNFFSNWRECFFWFLLGTAASMGKIVAAKPNLATRSDISP